MKIQVCIDFRMQKANEVSAALNAEVAHYRGVAKKYKRAKKVANWSAAGSSIISTAFSSASLGSALLCCGSSGRTSAGWRWWSIRSCFFRADNPQQKA